MMIAMTMIANVFELESCSPVEAPEPKALDCI